MANKQNLGRLRRWVAALLSGLTVTVLVAAVGPTINAAAADGGYRLPYAAGSSFTVSQGWGGQGLAPAYVTHTGESYYGYDFAMPEGTPVLAAADGWVMFTKGDVPADRYCNNSSCANDANYVTLGHSDGYETVYVHLSRVVVSPTKTVHRGQLIGYSGKTGWTGGYPHLHFQRSNPSDTDWYPQSIPISFDEYPGQQLLASSTAYTSQNTPQLTAPIVTVRSRNLLSSASFEGGRTDGWNHSSGANWAAYANGQAKDGQRYLAMNTGSAGLGASVWQDVSLTPTPGQSYTLSAWVRSPSGTPYSGELVVWANGGTQEKADTWFSASGGWTLVTAPLDVHQAGHTVFRAQVYMHTANLDLNVDGFHLLGSGNAR